MSNVQDIESAIIRLSPEEQDNVRDWLNDLAESRMEVSESFQDKICRARAELDLGQSSRVRPAGEKSP